MQTARPEYGYHVIKLSPGSPGAAAGLDPFFDSIVSVGEQLLDSEDTRLTDALAAAARAGTAVQLGVYSSKHDSTRLVQLVPRADWGGAGLLGATIRFCSLRGAAEQVWHVTNVHPGSPAARAGLSAPTDYVVGTPDMLFSEEDHLYTLLETHAGRAVPLYVYSAATDAIRVVTVTPGAWSGEGLLGCELGYGLLHRIPARPRPVAPPHVTVQSRLEPPASGASRPAAMTMEQLADSHPPVEMREHTHAHPEKATSLRRSTGAGGPPAVLVPQHLEPPEPREETHQPAKNPQTPPRTPPAMHHAASPAVMAAADAADTSDAPADDPPVTPMREQLRAPNAPAPSAPTTPAKVVPATPPSSSKASVEDHKKKLAALQEQLAALKKK